MTELILCMVAVFLVLWLMLLMSELHRLKGEVETLKRAMREKLNKTIGEVEVREGRKLTPSEIERLNRVSTHHPK